jgi:hypothetical protein
MDEWLGVETASARQFLREGQANPAPPIIHEQLNKEKEDLCQPG